MPKIEAYPTMNEVETASHVQLGRWWRFLRSPRMSDLFYKESEKEREILNRICDRFQELGGFTEEVSKEVGWE